MSDPRTAAVPPDSVPPSPTGPADTLPEPARSRGETTPDARAARAAHRRERLGRRGPWVLGGVFFVLYAAMSVLRYLRMETISWDLGIFEQAIRGYAHLGAPIVDLKGPGANVLGDHFSPITALVAPFYRVFPSPVTLLVVQAALFALSVVPVSRAAVRALGPATGLGIGLAYALSWGVQRGVDFDFHEIAFAMPLLAFALEALLRGRPLRALAWALPLLLVKEDMGATVAALALVVAWRSRRTDQRATAVALGTAAFALLAAVLIFYAIVPHFALHGTYDYWNKLDHGDAGPWAGLETKLRTLGWVLLPTTGLLALRSPLLLVAAPTLGWRFVSGFDHYWGTDWHYSAVLMPVVFLALVDALPAARASARPWLRTYARHLPAGVLAASLAVTATALPLNRLTETDTYAMPDRVAQVEQLLERIPDGATVEADAGPLISRLVARCRVFWIGDTRGITPQWIVAENSDHHLDADPLSHPRSLHPRAQYRVAGMADHTILYALIPPGAPTP
ncbi:DUF2079 domain-containing protein [Streptomyces sp. BI20]|uniref:DUF2079 domain-containing protein n=1 Tax=Streptomyces sp. BI20 TaxID=3403460 RepID=UPI003C77D42C